MKTLRTADIDKAFKMINTAKLSKMDDRGKAQIWHLCRSFKPVSNTFDEDIEDAKAKFIPYDAFIDDVMRAQKYELSVRNGDKTPDGCTKEEYDKIIESYREYTGLIDKAIADAASKEVEINTDFLTSDEFDQLCLSNEWTFDEIDSIADIISE